MLITCARAFAASCLHRLDLTAPLGSVNKFAALGLQIAFLDMGRQRRPIFLAGPIVPSALSFEGAAQYIFNTLIAAARKELVDERLKIGRKFNCMADFPSSLLS